MHIYIIKLPREARLQHLHINRNTHAALQKSSLNRKEVHNSSKRKDERSCALAI
jgi:hypothetical protein